MDMLSEGRLQRQSRLTPSLQDSRENASAPAALPRAFRIAWTQV